MSSIDWLIDHFKAKEEYRLHMIQELNLKPGDIVLDVGSGPGLWSEKLAEKVAPNGKVIGLDLSADAIAYSRQKVKKLTYKNLIEYVQGNFFEIPYEQGTFDITFCSNALMYFNDDQKVKIISEMKRVTRKGGKVISKEYDGEAIIVYPLPPERWLKLKSLVAQVLTETTSNNYYDEYVARKGRKLFIESGLTGLTSVPYVIQMGFPLSISAKHYITKECRWLIRTASPYLKPEEIEEFYAYFDVDSPQYILDREDFFYSNIEFMLTGIAG
jgi:ubiquinone/menaquinone biosynthesis C-methylase UbiE